MQTEDEKTGVKTSVGLRRGKEGRRTFREKH